MESRREPRPVPSSRLAFKSGSQSREVLGFDPSGLSLLISEGWSFLRMIERMFNIFNLGFLVVRVLPTRIGRIPAALFVTPDASSCPPVLFDVACDKSGIRGSE